MVRVRVVSNNQCVKHCIVYCRSVTRWIVYGFCSSTMNVALWQTRVGYTVEILLLGISSVSRNFARSSMEKRALPILNTGRQGMTTSLRSTRKGKR